MALRLLQRFGFLLSAFCVGCGGMNSLQNSPQQGSGFPAASAPMGAMTSTQITGTATSCSNFVTCVYTITTSQGHGSANSYATYVRYQLPAQAQFTTSLSYPTHIIGHIGNTYHVGGSFVAIDANTEKVVNGTTDDYIIQTQHCFRTCYYTYKLSSGTITFTLTNVDGTSASLACNPSTFNAGGSTTCTMTVTDLANSKSFPTGSIAFSTGLYQYGTFTPTSCALSSGSCSVKFAPFDESVGGIRISASYPGDSSHYMNSANTIIDVIGN